MALARRVALDEKVLVIPISRVIYNRITVLWVSYAFTDRETIENVYRFRVESLRVNRVGNLEYYMIFEVS